MSEQEWVQDELPFEQPTDDPIDTRVCEQCENNAEECECVECESCGEMVSEIYDGICQDCEDSQTINSLRYQ